MKRMKGVILAGGHGEELHPYTLDKPKALVKIVGKELILHTIDRLTAHNIRDITVVTGHMGGQIRQFLGNGNKFGISLNYIEQKEDGIDGAILALSKKFSKEEQFVLLHTDIIADQGILTRTLNAVNNLGTDMGLAVTLQEEIQDFGVVDLDADGKVKQVYPSGDSGHGNYVVAGTFVLTGKIFAYIDRGIPFNQCFNKFIEDGGEVATGIWNESWVDVGRPWDILRASKLVLSKIENMVISKDADLDPNAHVTGNVVIEEGARILSGAVINGPAYIGKDTLIGNNSLIREYSVIEEGAIVGMGCEIKTSTLLPHSTIARLSYIGDSIVGERTTIHAGCVTINNLPGQEVIESKIGDKVYTIPLDKFGAIIGPEVYVNPNCTLYPGTFIDKGTILEPNTLLK